LTGPDQRVCPLIGLSAPDTFAMDDLDALCSALETGGADGAANGTAVTLPVGSIDRPEPQQRQHAVLGPVCTNSPQKLRHAGTAPLAKSNPKSKASHKSNENGLGALVSKQQREAKAKAAAASAAQRKEAPPPPRRVFQDAGQATAVFRASGGLRVKNPVVSSSQLTTLMESMACIRIDQLRQRIIQDTIPKRWCTIGVVGELSTPRTTEGTGAQYGIWKLTDLNESMIYLYVFGSAYQDYKRSIAPGTLVCVVGGKTRRNGDSVNLSIDAYTQLVVLGESRDFGFCKGRTKSGDACRIPVNATRCEYCSYHVGKAYREMSSLRKELQGGSLKTAFGANKSKLKWSVGKFQSNTSGSNGNGNGKAQREAGLARLQSSAARVGGEHTMGTKYLVTCADPVKALNAVRDAESKKRQASMAKGTGFLKQAPIPARHLASVVVGERIGRETGSKRDRKNASDDAKVKKQEQRHGVVCGGGGAGGVSAPPSQAAMVNLDDDVGTSFAASLSSSLPARAQAAAIIQAKRASGEAIGQAPAAPAFLAKSLQAHKDKKQKIVSTKSTAKPAARPGKPATAVAKTHGKASSPPPDPGSFAALFGDVIREMEETHGSEGKVESRYKEAVEGEDHANLMSRLDVLEKKDAMAQKMEETTHLQVKAYRCEACSSLTERRHERCLKEHPHAISRIDTVKRWWSCSDCRKGFSTLGVSYPRGACFKCGSTVATFDKRGMHKFGLDSAQRWADAQGNAAIASREGMQPRGAEHGKFMSR